MKRILISGGKGQLGQCLKNIIPNTSEFETVYVDINELDISNYQDVSKFLKKNSFDYCVNCAAYTAVDLAEDQPEMAQKVNTVGPKNLALVCSKNNIVLIHISTDFVFDGEKTQPYIESDQTLPLGVYGKTKLEGEQEVINHLSSYFIIRTSWLYSAYGKNFVKTMLRLSNSTSDLKIVSDQIGSPTNAENLAKLIFKIISGNFKSYGLYHYSDYGKTSWYHFAKSIFKLKDIKVKISPIMSSEYPTAAKRPKYSVLDTKKTQKTFSFKAPDWEDSLKLCLSKL